MKSSTLDFLFYFLTFIVFQDSAKKKFNIFKEISIRATAPRESAQSASRFKFFSTLVQLSTLVHVEIKKRITQN